MSIIGYLAHTAEGDKGEPGLFYDYVMAGNGVFIEAKGPLLHSRALVAESEIRGLPPLDNYVRLPQGKVPGYYFELLLGEMQKTPDKERYAAITFDSAYHIIFPAQDGGTGAVQYKHQTSVVVDIHSHGGMRPFFSPTDDRDDQALMVNCVVGTIAEVPTVMVRVGIYGYHIPVKWRDIFEGYLSVCGAEEVDGLEAQVTEKEEEPAHELQNSPPPDPLGSDILRRRFWWNWRLRR
jgi:PRTRC genetic system protein A